MKKLLGILASVLIISSLTFGQEVEVSENTEISETAETLETAEVTENTEENLEMEDDSVSLSVNSEDEEELTDQEVDEEEEELTEEEIAERRSSKLRIGAYLNYTPVLGPLSDYIHGNVGFGIGAEYDLIKILGLNGGVLFNVNPPVSPALTFAFNAQVFGGVHLRINLFGDFYFQPEVDYGVIFNFPIKNSNFKGDLAPVYVDQIIQIAAAFRYKPIKLAKGRLEFEICPLYQLSPEKSDASHYVGLRTGLYWKFQ